MKKLSLVTLVSLLALSGNLLADEIQVPHQMNLQSLIYDENGRLSTSDRVDLTINIRDDQNRVVFTENHTAVPVVGGAVNLEVGSETGLNPDIFDPQLGGRTLDIAVSGNDAFDVMPLSAVPYSLWAEKAVTVQDDAITTEKIKNGTIKAEDLEPLTFSTLGGTIALSQLPAEVATDAELASHISSSSAHAAQNISVSSAFTNFTANNVLEAIQKIDEKLAEEIVRRRESAGSASTSLTTLQTTVNAHIASDVASAHSGTFPAARISGALSATNFADSTITSNKIVDGTITTNDIFQSETDSNSLDSRYVNESGDTMSGPLNVADDRGLPYINTGNFNVGRTLRNHENRIAAIEGALPTLISSGYIDPRRIQSYQVSVVREGGYPVYKTIFEPYFVTISQTCTAAVDHSGPAGPFPTLDPTKYHAEVSFSDTDLHPGQDLSITAEPEFHLTHDGDRPCVEFRIKFSFAGVPFQTDPYPVGDPRINYSIYQLIAE